MVQSSALRAGRPHNPLAEVIVVAVLVAGSSFAASPTLEQLRAVPQAKAEEFGPVQVAGRVCGSALLPATRDRPSRLVISFWSMANRRFFATFVADLTTAKVRCAQEAGFDKDAPRWPSVAASDWKQFFSCMNGGLAIYDPDADSFKLVRPISRASWLRGLAIGADGAVYMSDYPSGSAARYDPRTGAVEDYGPQGGPFNIEHIYGYSTGSDGEWVYTAVGKIPWYVVACHRATRRQKNLLRFEQADFPNVIMRGREVYLAATVAQASGKGAREEYYRLAGGAATRVDKLPPIKPQPGRAENGPQFELESLERALPVEAGGAVLRYRATADQKQAVRQDGKASSGADASWRKLVFPIEAEPYRVQRIAPLGDGRLLVATGDYGDVFLFDPATDKFQRLGNPANRNVYCLLPQDGKIYFGGYSNAFLGVFDDGRGKLLYDWNAMVGSKRSLSLAAGADGRIYLANQAEREFVGGSLAWWDPKTGQAGGIRFPNDECHQGLAALGGRLIVVATRAVRDPAHVDAPANDGHILVYDTQQQRVVQQFVPLPGEKEGGSAGMIAECAPGRILGLSSFRGKPTLYVAELLTGKVLQRTELADVPSGDLRPAPDGRIYSFLGRTLVSIDARTQQITPLLQTQPGQMAFLGSDLYLAGEPALRRIKGVADPSNRPKNQPLPSPAAVRAFEGNGAIDTRKAPAWWLSRPDEVEAFLRSLRGVEVFELGRSAGGRPILAAAWGNREDLPGRTSASLASAVAGGDPQAFYGKGQRRRQGFLFLGAAHGTEVEGTVAALNFLNVLATGKDLRGKAWPRMAEAGRQLRVVIVPFLNIDGRQRFREFRHFIGIHPDDYQLITNGRWKNGQPLGWPQSKLYHPVPTDRVDVLGSYYNDHGVNLVYDDAIGGACEPETRALVDFLRRERPDCVLCSHSDNGSLVQPASSFIPAHFRQRVVEIGALVGSRCRREGMKKSGIPTGIDQYSGQTFYQTDVIYHCCGALPLLVEFPCGYQNLPNNPDEILDTGLFALEEVAAFGAAYRFRPADPKWK